MDSDAILILIILFCIIFSAYFSATETAFTGASRIRLKNMVEKGNRKAKRALKLMDRYDSMLSTILIGNNIVNILAASLATVLFTKWITNGSGPAVSTVVVTVVVLIFGEISPKTLAKANPEAFAMFSAPFLRFLMGLFLPFNWLFGLWQKLLVKLSKSDEEHGITEEELLTIVDEAEQEGGLDEQESDLIRSAIEFTEQEAIDILTPRVDLVGVPHDASKEEIAKVFAESGFSRLPVYEDTIDNIIGIIYQKDFHNYVYHKEPEVRSILKPPLFINKSKKINDLLQELQQKKSHIAIVVDEFGGTTGIVTLEDILEELVGEIWDEHDEVVEEIHKESDELYFVMASTNIDKLFEELEMDDEDLEDADYSSVGGWAMDQLERVPEEGDTFEYKHLSVKVLSVDGNRVEKLQIIVGERQDEDEEDED